MWIDLQKNPKQEQFFNTAIEAVHGKNEYRNLFYGGAIRGGKTFVCLAVLTVFCKLFPGSRWHIFRSDFPALQATTIPSFEKIIAGTTNWRWNRDRANFFAYHLKTDAKIFFKGENITQDPELNDLLGLETNGIMFEQIEELSEKLWEVAISRNGSWYIDKMPSPITLSTFNPTQNWIKDKIYEPFIKQELKPPYYFIQALPNDNPYVTENQWQAWELLAPRYKKQYIEGDWTDFSDTNSLWAFAFNSDKHIGQPERRSDEIVYLSFDFNKNPICCSAIQHYEETIKVLETIKLANSDIYALCDYILVKYPESLFMVTGDATGQSTSALVKDSLNYYKVIADKLNLSSGQLKVPSVNPRLEDNKVLVNSILANYSVEIHKDLAQGLIFDLRHVKTLADGSIEKGDRHDPTKQADALDTFRYFCNIFMGDFLKFR